MDVPHDSEQGAVGPYDTHVDDRNCQDYSPAKRREIIEQIGDLLMQAWAEECPDSLDTVFDLWVAGTGGSHDVDITLSF